MKYNILGWENAARHLRRQNESTPTTPFDCSSSPRNGTAALRIPTSAARLIGDVRPDASLEEVSATACKVFRTYYDTHRKEQDEETDSLAPPKKKKKTIPPAQILPINPSAEAGPSMKNGKGSKSFPPATTSKPKKPEPSSSKSKPIRTRLVFESSGSSRGKGKKSTE
ncbi:hypothetical protein BDY24DRAFT_415094 [Mrakia frigida]|uniref:uncharacterized protein n=1 Tax=Mrakia frigida TaxID=29902 RepID=UPI003FCBEF6C